MKIIIGLTGEKGSGKDTFAMALQEIAQGVSVGRCRSSDILADTLDMWSLPRTRRNLQDLAIIMDKGYGLGTLTHALKERILKMPEDIIVFDAVRWESDRVMIRSFPHNYLVYITADIETRYERTKARKEKVGEAAASYEQFVAEEQVATELDIPKIGATADYVIDNTQSSIEELKTKIQQFYREKLT